MQYQFICATLSFSFTKGLSMKALTYCLALFVPLLIGGCAQTAAPRTLGEVEIGSAANARNIAVIPLHDDFIDLTGKIEALLAGQMLDGKPYFTLSDRATIERLISEHNLKNGDILEVSTAVGLGKALGAQAVISGAVDTPETHEQLYDVTRTKCKGEGEQRRCWEVKVMCKKHTVTLTADIRMVDVATSDILYADTMRRENAWHLCADSNNSLPSKASAVQSSADDIARDLVYRLTPHYLSSDTNISEKPGTGDSH